MLQILCPFFSSGKMLPLSLLGSCVLELELGGYDDCFRTGTNITNLWEIVRPVVFADVITVDPSLTNSFAQHLLNGKELPITFDGFFSSITSITAATSSSGTSSAVTVPIYRGFSRLKAIYVSFLYNSYPVNTSFVCPLIGNTVSTTANDTFRAYIQHGASRDPLYAIESLSECFYRNRKAAMITDGVQSFSCLLYTSPSPRDS